MILSDQITDFLSEKQRKIIPYRAHALIRRELGDCIGCLTPDHIHRAGCPELKRAVRLARRKQP